jgi:outer membrane protein assembly factor BamB
MSPRSRREFLAGVGVATAGSLAGCESFGDGQPQTPTSKTGGTTTTEERNQTDPATTQRETTRAPANLGGWPMFGYDRRNTGFTDEIAPINAITEFWSYDTEGAVHSAPIVHLGGIVLGTGAGSVLRIGGSGQASAWSVDLGDPVRGTPAVLGEVIVGVSDTGEVVGIGPDERTAIWDLSLDASGESPPVRSSPTTGDDAVYVGTDLGTIHAIGQAGQQRWQRQPDTSKRTTPALSEEVLIAGGTSGSVHAHSLESGSHRWQAPTGGPVHAAPAIAGSSVYVGSDDGRLYAFETATGRERWSRDTGGPVRASPAIGERIYAVNKSGAAMALAPQDGEVLWEVPLGEPLVTAPAVSYGTVFLAGEAGTVFALDTDDGRELWRYDLGDVSPTSAVVALGVLFVGTDGGTVHALAEP